jgi:hypothetical protein
METRRRSWTASLPMIVCLLDSSAHAESCEASKIPPEITSQRPDSATIPPGATTQIAPGPASAGLVLPPTAKHKQIPNGRILGIDFKNPPFHRDSQTWAKDVCGGGTWLDGSSPRYEWTPILNPRQEGEDVVVAVAGMAINPHPSPVDGDVWFTHPFGNDWNFDVVWASNPSFDFLMAPRVKPDEEEDGRRLAAFQTGLEGARVLHVETDSDFVPSPFRAASGESVAVFGRWIVDCGHDTFAAEIHPPLMQVRAAPREDGIGTVSTVISRPFLVSQEFDRGSLYDQLISESAKALNPVFPVTAKLTARPQVMAKPFSGIHLLTYLVRPPVKQLPGYRLFVRYHFTVRTGILVNAYELHDIDGTLGVSVLFDDSTYKPADLPPKKNWNVTLNQIKDQRDLGPKINAIEAAANIYGNPAGSYVVERGIDTDRYEFPAVALPAEELGAFADALNNNTKVTVDDSQPFPILGIVEVKWVPDLRVIRPPG